MLGSPLRPVRRQIPKLAVLAAAVVLLQGCTRDPVRVGSGQPLVMIQGVVVAGADSVSLQTAEIDSTGGSFPLIGAQLTLEIHDGDSVILEERPGPACGLAPGVTCHRGALPDDLGPEDRILLAGTLPDGTSISGDLQVPPAPLVTGPDGDPLEDSTDVTGDPESSLFVGYLAVGELSPDTYLAAGDHPAAVLLEGASQPISCTIGATLGRVPGAPGSGIVFEAPRCEGRVLREVWSSIEVQVTFLRYDPELAELLRTSRELGPIPDELGSVNLEGAYGAVGAASGLRLDIEIEASSAGLRR
jgi:hypothetical protein